MGAGNPSLAQIVRADPILTTLGSTLNRNQQFDAFSLTPKRDEGNTQNAEGITNLNSANFVFGDSEPIDSHH